MDMMDGYGGMDGTFLGKSPSIKMGVSPKNVADFNP